MKKFLQVIYCLFTFFATSFPGYGQGCGSMNIQFQSDIPSVVCSRVTMTMMHDQLGKPYLYVAEKEGGLKIYNINNLAAPLLIKTIPINSIDTLHVMSLSQQGNYVYIATGNHFNANQNSGMAIVDVTDPTTAFVTDSWRLPASAGGSGFVKAEGNYAYLGAMGNGLILLDVTNKANISFVSQFIPDINYPTPNPTASLYNARGMEVKNGIVYLCYDAGGLRIINTTNKSAPVETGRYSNPIMNGKPRAYNNIILDDSLVYITVDYCGLEVLNVSDTGNITLAGWWNPYNCPNNNWFSSPSHANEIQYNKTCKQLFISTGKSDLIVLDISNPTLPDSCNYYGGVSNNIGTWGVGLYQDQVYLSYICTLGIPFASNWTGVKILTYTPCLTGIRRWEPTEISIHPNPATSQLIIQLDTQSMAPVKPEIRITTMLGQEVSAYKAEIVSGSISLGISALPEGVYFLTLQTENTKLTGKFIKADN